MKYIEKYNPSILLFSDTLEDGHIIWCAQCMEKDICSQGDTPMKALESLDDIIRGTEITDVSNGTEPLSQLPPLPADALLQILPPADSL